MTENAMKPYVIGLDLGGTNSVFGIVDARGEIKATTAIKTGGYDNVDDYVKAATEVAVKLLVCLVSHIFFFADISDVSHNHTADIFYSAVFCDPSGHFVQIILYCILLFPVKSLDMIR